VVSSGFSNVVITCGGDKAPRTYLTSGGGDQRIYLGMMISKARDSSDGDSNDKNASARDEAWLLQRSLHCRYFLCRSVSRTDFFSHMHIFKMAHLTIVHNRSSAILFFGTCENLSAHST
jgi:hypothetical protein